MEKKSEASSTGRITRVDKKYAYLSSDRLGCVFVPPRSVLPTACAISDLTCYLKAGDVVHFTAVPQQGKNECKWLATKVTLSSNNETYQNLPLESTSAASRQQVVIVTLVTETFAYAMNEELGTVFVPGAAFPSTEVSKLDSYIACGDSLVVLVRPQALRSGCNWIAESATKVSSCDISSAEKLLAKATELGGSQVVHETKKGSGVVLSVSKDIAHVRDAFGDTLVCSALAWIGGDRGNIHAKGLDEVTFIGETVYFYAVRTDDGWQARQWSFVPHSRKTCDSYTQTAMSPEQMIVRALDKDLVDHLRRKMPAIMAYNDI